MSNKQIRQTGFTVVELVVSIVVMGILTVLVLDTLGDYYTDNLQSAATTVQETDTRATLRTIEQDLNEASGFVGSLTGLQAPLGRSNGTSWSYTGGGSTRQALIAEVIATNERPLSDADNNRLPVFLPNGSDCSAANALPAKVSYVYYVAQDPTSSALNLYRRTLTPIGVTYCNGIAPWQKRSCWVGSYTDTNGYCESRDAILVNDVSSFQVKYFASSNDTSASVDSTVPTGTAAAVSAAQTVVITLKTNRVINGNDKEQTATIRITKSS